jgi:hypothetical protein
MPSTVRVGRGACVQLFLPARTSTNDGKEDNVVAGERRPALEDGVGEHSCGTVEGVCK